MQGPIDPCAFVEHQTLECLDQGNGVDLGAPAWAPTLGAEGLRLGDNWFTSFCSLSPQKSAMPNLSFLNILEPARASGLCPYFMDSSHIQALELESCITHVSETYSPEKPGAKDIRKLEEAASSVNREPNSPENGRDHNSGSSSGWVRELRAQPEAKHLSTGAVRERKKRKRSKACKNSREVESQRMTHIAVERNRRKQMNEHLNALRSLMPASFIQRGDQASIIGGAIDFVKELEQLLQSLQAKKQTRQSEEGYSPTSSTVPFNGFFSSPQYTTYSNFKYMVDGLMDQRGNEFKAENKSAVADIEVTLIQTHANLKILSPRRPGQLLKTIAALENLELTILHLNITTIQHSVLYSFNLKIEEGCKLGSADEIAAAVHQIFSFINEN
ncbi:transcription factor bHLH94 isoform X2 [Amborella trichopoda]|uniref:transcription factor bHLH94 isoform X2 n=1 Tax=Amborella trichopoda TaxID=13333 RepID=UPI0009BE4EDA|nr:transcription factor bHLH94 isoform X2 [Amborella trichopoda]|eukprot:XP_020532221.1 transcription factor bHLH94 isoform X2 [Amborella trichopoda]